MENDKMKIHIQITSDDGTIYHGDAMLQNHGATVKRPVVESSSKPTSHKCPDIIALLWQEGHFKQELSIADIKKALDATGHSFTTQNILTVLPRTKFLTRHGSRRSYTWKQKYPFH
jgi:hypothetical protein